MFARLTTSLAAIGAATALVVPPAAVLPADPMALADSRPPPMAAGQPRATIELACPSCPLAVGQIHGHPKGWSTGPDTRLLIELTSDGSQLYFNGAPIYPLASTSLSRKLAAKQVYMEPNDPLAVEELYSRPLALSSGIEVHDQVEMLSFHLDAHKIENIVERIPMRSLDIEIMGLGEKMVKVDTIRVKFSDDKLAIHDVNIIPYGTNDSEDEKNCDTVLCRLRTDLEAKLAALREKMGSAAAEVKPATGSMKLPCPKKQKQLHEAAGDTPSAPAGMPMPFHSSFRKVNGKFIDDAILAGFKGGHPAGHPAGDPHNTGARLPGFRAGMDAKWAGFRGHASGGYVYNTITFLYHIILPVMVGIGAGMLVSGIGMLIGQLVVMACQKIWGTGEYEQVEVVVLDDEERFFIDDAQEEEFLPRYEDVDSNPPPAFDESFVGAFGGDEKEALDGGDE